MGTIRELLIAPRWGELPAVLLGSPMMLFVSWLTCGSSIRCVRCSWTLRRSGHGRPPDDSRGDAFPSRLRSIAGRIPASVFHAGDRIWRPTIPPWHNPNRRMYALARESALRTDAPMCCASTSHSSKYDSRHQRRRDAKPRLSLRSPAATGNAASIAMLSLLRHLRPKAPQAPPCKPNLAGHGRGAGRLRPLRPSTPIPGSLPLSISKRIGAQLKLDNERAG